MTISDYSLTSSDIMVLWDDELGNPVEMTEPNRHSFSHFILEAVKTGSNDLDKTKMGHFSSIFLDFHFKRQSTIYIITIFVPCSMFVMLSWISFWLGPSVTARLSLTLTLLLTMATQIQGANQNWPQVSYIKALDVWTGFCMIMGALAILQSATVAFIMQQNIANIVISFKDEGKRQKMFGYDGFARKFDVACRLVFPLGFIGFAVGYVFLYIVKESPIV
jgi:hypothetical protein